MKKNFYNNCDLFECLGEANQIRSSILAYLSERVIERERVLWSHYLQMVVVLERDTIKITLVQTQYLFLKR